ncbi:MAG: SPOR domain-containing protein [Tannerella sp.]|nr:SPOR domain-containing protein [Tannerella sp.]
MLEIATHIERLLLVNDCVIIPDFGGFVLQSYPAVHAREAHQFRPSHREIVFSPTLKHDDGLIAGSYMRAYGMTFNQARSALKKDIEDLKMRLDEPHEVVLAAIGSFRKETEGGVVFQPVADCAQFSLSSYGLTSFHLPPVPTEKLPVKPVDDSQPIPVRKSAHVIYLPINRTLAYVAGLSVAAVALSLVIMTPLKEIHSDSYTAGFAPSEVVRRLTPVGEMPVVAEENMVAEQTNPAETEPLTVSVIEQTNGTKSTKIYYVIIGSFETENQARTFIEKLDSTLSRNSGIIQRDKHVRVFAGKYDSRKEAEDRISLLREDKRFKDTWLFAGR